MPGVKAAASSPLAADDRPAGADGGSSPSDFEPRVLLRRGLPALVAIVALALIAMLAPGLGEVRRIIGDAKPGWIALAVLLEALSFGSYIVMFAPIFCRKLGWRRSWQIGGSELAMGSLVPASGAGGLALGAWVLHEGGMDGERIARRSVAFFMIKSAVNFVAVVVVGALLFAGILGPDLSWSLTILPAGAAALAIVVAYGVSRLPAATEPEVNASRPRRIAARMRGAVTAGTAESFEILGSGNGRVIAGALGYWAFDNAVLWATFRAFGFSPEISVVLIGYLIGQLGGLLPIPGGVGGIDGGLIGALIVYGTPAAVTVAAVLAYRVILFWLPLLVGGLAFVTLRRDMPGAGELAAAAPRGHPTAGS